MLIMTHFNFDIDKLIETIETTMKADTGATGDVAENPGIYVRSL